MEKTNARLKFLYRKNKFLNSHTKRLLVMSLIQYHFDYACSFYYLRVSQLPRNRLRTTQNKIVSFVLKMCPWSNTGQDVFKAVGQLSVS